MKNTIIRHISSHSPEQDIIDEAAALLRAGGLVAFPTETVYGLGADAINPLAVASVFVTKGRPADNPLIVHIARIEQIYELSPDVTEDALTLVKHFWPGPLTIILKASEFIPRIVTGGLDTVALRMPAHPVPRALSLKLTHGMVGPSANISGRPSPTTAQHVLDDFSGKIDFILDAGPAAIGVESTVVDATVSPPLILRAGGVPREELERVIPGVHAAKAHHHLRQSPGTRYRHYAPRARVVLVEEGSRDVFESLLHRCRGQHLNIGGIIHTAAWESLPEVSEIRLLRFPASEYPRRLFDSLRKLDRLGVDVIIVEAVPEHGIGAAVMDRLRRAAE